MRRLIESMARVREKSSVYARIMAGYPLARIDPRPGCFWKVHNKAIIAEEILSMYNNIWKGLTLPSGIDEDRLDQERLERVVSVSRSFFIDTMSALEHCAMQVLPIYEDTPIFAGLKEYADERRYLYMRDFIRGASAYGYVDAVKLEDWNNLITIRNLSVHNNAISDRSLKCLVGYTKISMRPNRMMKGAITAYVELAETALDHFYELLNRLEDQSDQQATISPK